MDTLNKNKYYTLKLILRTEGDFITDPSKNMFFNTAMLDTPIKNNTTETIYFVPDVILDKELLNEALEKLPTMGKDLRNIFTDYNTFSAVIETSTKMLGAKTEKNIDKDDIRKKKILLNNLNLLKSIFFPTNGIIKIRENKYSIYDSAYSINEDEYKKYIKLTVNNRNSIQFYIKLKLIDLSIKEGSRTNFLRYSCNEKAANLAAQARGIFGTSLGFDNLKFQTQSLKRTEKKTLSQAEINEKETAQKTEELKSIYSKYKYPGIMADKDEITALENSSKAELSNIDTNSAGIDAIIKKQNEEFIKIQKEQKSALSKLDLGDEDKANKDKYNEQLLSLQQEQRKMFSELQTTTISKALFGASYTALDKSYQAAIDDINYSFEPSINNYVNNLRVFFKKVAKIEIDVNKDQTKTPYKKYFSDYKAKKIANIVMYINNAINRDNTATKTSDLEKIDRTNKFYIAMSPEDVIKDIEDRENIKTVLKSEYKKLDDKLVEIKSNLSYLFTTSTAKYNNALLELFRTGAQIEKEIMSDNNKNIYLKYYQEYNKKNTRNLFDYIVALIIREHKDQRSYSVDSTYITPVRNNYDKLNAMTTAQIMADVMSGGKRKYMKRKTMKRKNKKYKMNKVYNKKIYTYKKKRWVEL